MFSALSEGKDEKIEITKELHPESGVLVRFALIGVGAVAAFHHIPGIRIDPRASLEAICDPNKQLLDQRSTEWGPVKATTNYEEIANDPNIDAVIIATPNSTHVKIALECLKNGKHVMLEKPLGVSAKEALQLQKAAEESKVVNMTAFTYRYAPSMRYLKHLISEGKLGQLRHFRSQRFLDWPETSWGWRQYKDTAGAGNIYDMTIHRIDFSQYLMGKIKSVSGKVKQFIPRTTQPNGESCAPSEVDDWTAIIAEFENGATGVFEGSTLMKGHHNNNFGYEWAEVNGSEGSAVYQLQDPFHLLFGKHGESLQKLAVPKEYMVVDGSPRKPDEGVPSTVFRYDQLYAFVTAILEKSTSKIPTFADGALAQVVADAALLSDKERRWVDIDTFSTDTFVHEHASVAKNERYALQGKYAVITGGGTGIGRAIALKFASEGSKVYILGRRPEVLQEVVEEHKKANTKNNLPSITPVQCDVGDEKSVAEVFKKLLDEGINIDILVNSAGTNIPNRHSDVLTPQDYRQVMSANVDGAFYCIHAVLPQMKKQKGGLIINISSVAGLRGLPLAGSAYVASKFAMNGLGSCIGAEQYKNGIRVTNICPGEVNTPIIDRRAVPDPPEKRAQMLQAEDLAEAAFMVASLPPRAQVSELVIKPTVQEFWQ